MSVLWWFALLVVLLAVFTGIYPPIGFAGLAVALIVFFTLPCTPALRSSGGPTPMVSEIAQTAARFGIPAALEDEPRGCDAGSGPFAPVPVAPPFTGQPTPAHLVPRTYGAYAAPMAPTDPHVHLMPNTKVDDERRARSAYHAGRKDKSVRRAREDVQREHRARAKAAKRVQAWSRKGPDPLLVPVDGAVEVFEHEVDAAGRTLGTIQYERDDTQFNRTRAGLRDRFYLAAPTVAVAENAA